MSGKANAELVELAQRGDNAAIGELYTRFWRAARAAAFGVTGDWGLAEDAAAEGFSHALAGLGSLQDSARFAAWLRTIVVRRARAGRRRAAAELNPHLADVRERPDEALQNRELAVSLQQAIRRLPERLREAIALIYFEGFESGAAARFLDVPPGTLRRRLHEGRKLLRELLENGWTMSDKHKLDEERVKELLASGDTYRAIRESVALRRAELLPPAEGVAGLARRLTALQEPRNPACPTYPVEIALRSALNRFGEWPLDSIETSVGLVRCHGIGGMQTMFELLRESPDEESFASAVDEFRISNVLDLRWTNPPLELHRIQDALGWIATEILPQRKWSFSSYAEPRYRSALQLHIDGRLERAAIGGVLSAGDSAHVRIFLESWTPDASYRPIRLNP